MVVLAIAAKGSFDVKRAQCSWTQTRTLELCVYMALHNDWIGWFCAAVLTQAAPASQSKL